MGIKITKVAFNNAAKVGIGIEVLEQLRTNYRIVYAPYAKRYTIYILGNKFTGIGPEGLVKIIKQSAELGLKVL